MTDSGDSALELRILRRVRDVPQKDWDALVGDAGSPFVEHAWLDCLEESGCVGALSHDTADLAENKSDHASGWLASHIAVYRKGKLIAAAPAYLKGNSEGEFVFDWSWADLAHRMRVPYYPKLIVAVPFTPVTGERVLVAKGEDRPLVVRSIATALRELSPDLGTHSVHALFSNETETNEWEIAGYLPRLGVQFHWRNPGYASWDDFLKTFNSKKRNQLRRERAQPAKDGVTIRTLDASEITPAAVSAMYDFYVATVDKFSWGRRYLTRRFFDLVAERFTSRLSWVLAEKDGVPIAGAFNVEKGDRLYGRYWGARTELPFLHFNVCYYHGIEHAIARGLKVFEPGAGGEHKRVRGFLPTATYSAHYLQNARLRAPIAEFLGREREAIRRLLDEGDLDDQGL